MDTLYNFITKKYKLSKDIYKIILDKEKTEIFLFYFDVLNVYTLFPFILEFPITMNDHNIINNNITSDNIVSIDNDTANVKYYENYNNENKKLKILLKNTINELQGNYEDSNDKFIRKLFSYEIVDNITDNFNGEYVTVAWLKCYEIITWYNIIPNKNNIKYFGICEQPGAFVYAINHYIKTNYNCNFDFVLQSLKTNISHRKVGFKAENHLYDTYKNKYDYGISKTGDVTDLNNIKYYRQKYYDDHFDIITADCGLDSSDDYSLQEKKIFKIFYAQVLIALSLADVGTNYFTKLFTVYNIQTACMLMLLSSLFEQVFLTRVLTTKPVSGEVYLVCKNFKYDKNYMQPILEKLYDCYQNDTVPTLNNIDTSKCLNMITKYNEILLHRRIISYRFSYFRYNNKKYTTEHEDTINHVNALVKHYVNYYINIYKLKPLEDKDKLVKFKFVNKWSNK